MTSLPQLQAERTKIDEALNNLIQQGEVGPPDQRDSLGQSYNELWKLRQGITKQMGEVQSATPATARPAAPAGKRQIRWGVVAVGGVGVLALVGLIGWQLYKLHGKRKSRKKRRSS